MLISKWRNINGVSRIFLYMPFPTYIQLVSLLLKLKAHCLIKITSLVIFHPRLQFTKSNLVYSINNCDMYLKKMFLEHMRLYIDSENLLKVPNPVQYRNDFWVVLLIHFHPTKNILEEEFRKNFSSSFPFSFL